jgi:4'-phosphopantetheinyl transferase
MNGMSAGKNQKVAWWRTPPDTLSLGDDDVHVWRVRLNQSASRLRSVLHILAADEHDRAERFYFHKDRERFIVARGALRAILSCYLNLEPRHLSFGYGPYGKPALARDSDGDALRFNVSHSHGLALVAVTRGREIGVDLERISAEAANEQIAERFFSPREIIKLRSLPTDRQTEAFFHCWTRKEAYIKARGEGLSLPLDQFDVSLVPGEPAALLSTQADPHEASRWGLQELVLGPGYVAALAVEGHDWQLQCWRWAE